MTPESVGVPANSLVLGSIPAAMPFYYATELAMA
jgi:hypothetical protein